MRTLERRRVAVVKSAIQSFLSVYSCALAWPAEWLQSMLSPGKGLCSPLKLPSLLLQGLPGAHAGLCGQAAAQRGLRVR